MDWLRRNWPDLLIGVALIIVIAMIVITLLSGGSLASLVRRDSPQPFATTAATEDTNGDAAGTTASGTPAATSAAAPANTAANTTSNTTANTTTDGTGAADGYDVFVPGVPGREGDAEGGQAADTTGTSADTSASTGDQDSDGDVGSEIDAPLPSASRTGGFRVAAGATSSRDGARTLAQSYRDDGLEVTVEQNDDLYLLWVGPYGTRADADTVAERIIAGGGDALVYGGGADAVDDTGADTDEATADTTASGSSNGVAGTDALVSAVTDAPSSGAAGNGARTPNATADNASSGNADTGTARTGNTSGTAGNAAAGNEVAEDLAAGAGLEQYLQVGAFASDASAAPRLEQLEQLSLSVTSSESDNGLLRLFVGPYSEAQIAQIQTRLSAQGIESFPVSQ